MKGDSNVVAQELERLALESRRRQGSGHPTAQRLAAYHDRALEPAELDEIQDHLAVCGECARELLALARFERAMADEPAEGAAGTTPTPAETAASWQALRARLAPQLEGPGIPEPKVGERQRAKAEAKIPRSFPYWMPSPRVALQLSVALLACVIGLQLWIYLHRARPAELITIQPGVFEVTRGPEESRPPISLSLDDATTVLSLRLPVRPSFTAYRIEIRTLSGELRLAVAPSPVPMASRTDVSANTGTAEPERLVSFGLPQGSLPHGDYRLRLVGRQGARQEVLAEHRLRVRNP